MMYSDFFRGEVRRRRAGRFGVPRPKAAPTPRTLPTVARPLPPPCRYINFCWKQTWPKQKNQRECNAPPRLLLLSPVLLPAPRNMTKRLPNTGNPAKRYRYRRPSTLPPLLRSRFGVGGGGASSLAKRVKVVRRVPRPLSSPYTLHYRRRAPSLGNYWERWC